MVAPEIDNAILQEEMKKVRLRQQLEHYYKGLCYKSNCDPGSLSITTHG